MMLLMLLKLFHCVYSKIYQNPALTFFHIPVPKVRDLWFKEFCGAYQEPVACSKVNSGALKTIAAAMKRRHVYSKHCSCRGFFVLISITID